MPKRIQRLRTKGWRKPADAIIIDRTSRWGNPFRPYKVVKVPGWYLNGFSHWWNIDIR